MEPTRIPCVSAQWTHEAAREGRPVSELPVGRNGSPRGNGPNQGSLFVSRYKGRLAWHDFAPLALTSQVCGFCTTHDLTTPSHRQRLATLRPGWLIDGSYTMLNTLNVRHPGTKLQVSCHSIVVAFSCSSLLLHSPESCLCCLLFLCWRAAWRGPMNSALAPTWVIPALCRSPDTLAISQFVPL